MISGNVLLREVGIKKILVGLMCGVAATAASAVDLHIASMAANGRLVEIIDVDSIAREKHVTRVNVIREALQNPHL